MDNADESTAAHLIRTAEAFAKPHHESDPAKPRSPIAEALHVQVAGTCRDYPGVPCSWIGPLVHGQVKEDCWICLVSTAGSRRINACILAIFRAPRAREIVTTAGRASGIAATARLTAVRKMSTGGSPRKRPTANRTTQIPRTATARRRPKPVRRCCKSVLISSSLCRSVAICPNSVYRPVPTTIPSPRPYVISGPL